MSRGSMQLSTDRRLRTRPNRKPKRLLRSWFKLIRQQYDSGNGDFPFPEQIKRDVKRRNSQQELKDSVCDELPSCLFTLDNKPIGGPAKQDDTSLNQLQEKACNGRKCSGIQGKNELNCLPTQSSEKLSSTKTKNLTADKYLNNQVKVNNEVTSTTGPAEKSTIPKGKNHIVSKNRVSEKIVNSRVKSEEPPDFVSSSSDDRHTTSSRRSQDKVLNGRIKSEEVVSTVSIQEDRAVGKQKSHLNGRKSQLDKSKGDDFPKHSQTLEIKIHSDQNKVTSSGSSTECHSQAEQQESHDRDSDVNCCVCSDGESEPPNEIVICDTCNKGYHQECHVPKVGDEVLLPNIPWHCRNCVPVGSIRKSAKNLKNGEAIQTFKLGFPYDMNSLEWDILHRTNKQDCYCYCGGPGEWTMKMLQCKLCKQWFHEACIQGLETPLLCGDRFYYFCCSVCNSGPEIVKRLPLTWTDVTHLTLYNMCEFQGKMYSDIDQEILPYLDSIWLALQLPSDMARASKGERRNQINICLKNNANRFKCGREVKKKTSLWGLRSKVVPPLPTRMSSSCEAKASSLTRSCKDIKNTSIPVSSAPIKKTAKKHVAGSPHLESSENRAGKPKRMLNSNGSEKALSQKATLGLGKNPKPVNGLSKTLVEAYPAKPDPWLSDEDDESLGSTLDSIIPPPADFEGINHPFRNLDGFHLKPQRTRTAKRKLSQEDIRVAKNGEIRRRYRRRRHHHGDIFLAGGQGSEGSLDTGSESENVLDKLRVSSLRVPQIPFGDLGSSVSHYFSAANRIASGERFNVLARRVTTDGKVQYLIEWEGSTT